MSNIKYSGLDQYGAEPLNSSNLEQLALKGLRVYRYVIYLRQWEPHVLVTSRLYAVCPTLVRLLSSMPPYDSVHWLCCPTEQAATQPSTICTSVTRHADSFKYTVHNVKQNNKVGYTVLIQGQLWWAATRVVSSEINESYLVAKLLNCCFLSSKASCSRNTLSDADL